MKFFRTPSIVFTFILLIVNSWLLYLSLQTGFTGGPFVTISLIITVLLVITSLIIDTVKYKINQFKMVGESETLDVEENEDTGVTIRNYKSNHGFNAFAISFGAILLIPVFGVFLGTFLFAGWILRYYGRMTWVVVLGYSVVIGFVIPYVFITWLSVRIWLGIIPSIIPGWIGGGSLPPL